MLAYLTRYTHRVAIANSRLIAFDDNGVTFRWKDYRAKGRERHKVMTLASDEFIRRFLIHVLPSGFHRIRHYGLFANGGRAENLARARELLGVPAPQDEPGDADANADEPPMRSLPCPCCGGRMIIIETFERGSTPQHPSAEPDQDRHIMMPRHHEHDARLPLAFAAAPRPATSRLGSKPHRRTLLRLVPAYAATSRSSPTAALHPHRRPPRAARTRSVRPTETPRPTPLSP